MYAGHTTTMVKVMGAGSRGMHVCDCARMYVHGVVGGFPMGSFEAYLSG